MRGDDRHSQSQLSRPQLINGLRANGKLGPIVVLQDGDDRSSGQFTLTWTSEPRATYAVQSSSDLQSGFSDLVTGVPSAGSTTTVTVNLYDPNKSFVRIRKQ